MNRGILGLLTVVASLILVDGAFAEGQPEFKLGFKNLADQIPDVAGQPVEDEHFGPNGDSLQTTTTGLMVWRKADNWTAFTDGTRSWINGPNGIQDRPNDVRFVWETEIQTPASAPTSSYSPQVRAMDTESGGPGLVVKRMMGDIESQWANSWGWRPSKPTTIYLFIDGYHMTSGMPAITGQQLTNDQRRYYATEVPALNTQDVQTGGWAIIANISSGMGTADWESITKAMLLRQYTYVMVRDAAGYAGPTWFIEGLARICAEAQVPSDPVLHSEMSWVYDSKKRGLLPTLTRLNDDWAGFVSIGPSSLATANGVSFLSVRILADKVGQVPLLEVLKRTSRGEDFAGVLKAVTGYTVAQLDTEYRAKLQ